MVLWQVWQWLPSPAWVMLWQWRILTGLEVKREAENELLWQLLHGNVMNTSLSPFTKGWYWLSVISVILLTIVRYVGWLTKCIWQINTRGDNDRGANHLFLPVSLKKWMKCDLLRKELCVKLNTQMSYKHFFQVFSHHEFLDVIIFHFLMRVKTPAKNIPL